MFSFVKRYHLHIKKAAQFYAQSPHEFVRALGKHYMSSEGIATTSLLTTSVTKPRRKLSHVGVFGRTNMGDYLLPIALRDSFDVVNGKNAWKFRQARPYFEWSDIRRINSSDGLVIGGGGLFLRDTNANLNSGWQWNCTLEKLAAIKVPIAVFAVGYNRFRGQPDFDPIFRDHVTLLAEKSIYLGLRNTGSVEAIRSYIPSDLADKVKLQPCMTTLLAKICPQLIALPCTQSLPRIAVNIAFDRAELRFGRQEVDILTAIAKALSVLSTQAEIDLVVHVEPDAHFMPFLRSAGVPFHHIDFRSYSAEEMVEYYANVDLVIGMRGHAQMIPFGCQTPIISLISHNKMKWFLDDIDRNDWGVEITSPTLVDEIVEKARGVFAAPQDYKQDIATIQEWLWQVSVENIETATKAFDKTRAG